VIWLWFLVVPFVIALAALGSVNSTYWPRRRVTALRPDASAGSV